MKDDLTEAKGHTPPLKIISQSIKHTLTKFQNNYQGDKDQQNFMNKKKVRWKTKASQQNNDKKDHCYESFVRDVKNLQQKLASTLDDNQDPRSSEKKTVYISPIRLPHKNDAQKLPLINKMKPLNIDIGSPQMRESVTHSRAFRKPTMLKSCSPRKFDKKKSSRVRSKTIENQEQKIVASAFEKHSNKLESQNKTHIASSQKILYINNIILGDKSPSNLISNDKRLLMASILQKMKEENIPNKSHVKISKPTCAFSKHMNQNSKEKQSGKRDNSGTKSNKGQQLKLAPKKKSQPNTIMIQELAINRWETGAIEEQEGILR